MLGEIRSLNCFCWRSKSRRCSLWSLPPWKQTESTWLSAPLPAPQSSLQTPGYLPPDTWWVNPLDPRRSSRTGRWAPVAAWSSGWSDRASRAGRCRWLWSVRFLAGWRSSGGSSGPGRWSPAGRRTRVVAEAALRPAASDPSAAATAPSDASPPPAAGPRWSSALFLNPWVDRCACALCVCVCVRLNELSPLSDFTFHPTAPPASVAPRGKKPG